MAEVPYYFDGHSASQWTDPDNFDDGSIETFATESADGEIHTFNSNTCPGTDLGTILKVELRVHGYGDGNDRIDLTPVFAGGDGDEHQTTPGAGAAWGSYVDITGDTNAPSPWTWAAVQGLDCKAEYDKVGAGGTMYGSKVQIRVTHLSASEFDIGGGAIDRASEQASIFTYIDKNNPASSSGTLHSVEVWAAQNITGLRVGTFYTTNGDTLKCRDSAVLGDVVAGAKRTFTELSIDVQEGDYIGCFFTDGFIEAVFLAGFPGVWLKYGENIDPGDETTYSFYSGQAISLYGYGDIGEGPTPPEYIPRASGAVAVLML